MTLFVMVSSALYTVIELVLRKRRGSGYTPSSTDLLYVLQVSAYYYYYYYSVWRIVVSSSLGQAPVLSLRTPCTIYIFSHMNEAPPQFIQSFFLHIFFKLGAHGVSHTLRLCHTRAHPLCASPTQ